MEITQLLGLISFAVIVVVAIILVRRSRSLREKEFAAWRENYEASTTEPETDPTVLRTLWTNDLSSRDLAHREAALAQTNPELVAQAAATGTPTSVLAQQTRTNALAVLALIFSILGGWIGVLLGHIALWQIKRTRERGRWMAVTALVVGYGWIALYLSFIITGIVTAFAR